MRHLDTALLAKKNLLATDGVYAYCMLITLSDGTEIPITTNGENVLFKGITYVPFAFKINSIGGEKAGEIPQSTVQVSNVSRSLEPYLESGRGGVGADVVISVANTSLPTHDALYVAKFLCVGCECDSNWVTFTLGISSPLRMRFPKNMIRKNQCTWRFRSTMCGYLGTEFIACDKTLSSCGERGNSLRFGNFPGAGRGGLDI